MKKLILVSMVLASTVFAQTRTVAEKKSTVTSANYGSSSGSGMRLGIGFATYGGGLIGGTAHTLSVAMNFGELVSLQPYFGVMSSSPFTFGGGAVFKYTLHGGADNGFHTGLGFTLGTIAGAAATTSFFADIWPVLGFHFNLGGHVSNLVLAFDVGPLFHVTPTFQFAFSSISGIGGASLHYMF